LSTNFPIVTENEVLFLMIYLYDATSRAIASRSLEQEEESLDSIEQCTGEEPGPAPRSGDR
jgi:hypothetical protein